MICIWLLFSLFSAGDSLASREPALGLFFCRRVYNLQRVSTCLFFCKRVFSLQRTGTWLFFAGKSLTSRGQSLGLFSARESLASREPVLGLYFIFYRRVFSLQKTCIWPLFLLLPHDKWKSEIGSEHSGNEAAKWRGRVGEKRGRKARGQGGGHGEEN